MCLARCLGCSLERYFLIDSVLCPPPIPSFFFVELQPMGGSFPIYATKDACLVLCMPHTSDQAASTPNATDRGVDDDVSQGGKVCGCCETAHDGAAALVPLPLHPMEHTTQNGANDSARLCSQSEPTDCRALKRMALIGSPCLHFFPSPAMHGDLWPPMGHTAIHSSTAPSSRRQPASG